MKLRQSVLACTLMLGVTALQPTHAYLDPGTGSILLQGLIAAVAAVTVAGRIYWGKIKSLFRSQQSTNTAVKREAPDESESKNAS